MWMLIFSFVAMAVGPVLFRLAGGSCQVLAALDAFVLATLGGLVLAHIVPQSMAMAGGAALLATLGGMVGLVVLERSSSRLAASVWRAALPILLVGLAIHAFLDGVGTAHGGHDHGHSIPTLGLAVVLHRIPVGLAIWWGIRPKYGTSSALGVMGLIIVFTAVGNWYGEQLIAQLPPVPLALLQAFIGGAILHGVVGHTFDAGAAEDGTSSPRAGALGALAGVLLLVGLSFVDPPTQVLPQDLSAGSTFITLALESSPYLVLAYLLIGLGAGVIHPPNVAGILGLPRVIQAVRGTFLGIMDPGGNHGGLAGYRRLATQDAPPTAALSLLMASPLLELAALMLSLELLGWKLTLARGLGAVGLSIIVGWFVGRYPWQSLSPRPQPSSNTVQDEVEESDAAHSRAPTGFVAVVQRAVDETAGWMLLGLGIGAIVEALFFAQWLEVLPTWLEPAFAAVLGLPLFLCATGVTPLVAVLMHKGLSGGAAIALLLTGSALSGGVFREVALRQGRRAAWMLVATLLVVAVLMGSLIDLGLPGAHSQSLHAFHGERHGWLEYVSLGIVTLLFLGSLFRLGARGTVAQIFGRSGGHLYNTPLEDNAPGALPVGHPPGEHEHHPHGHSHTGSHGHAHAHGHPHRPPGGP